MAKLALKPQVAAFLEIATSHGGPDLRFEEIEIHREYPQAGAHDPRAARALDDRRGDRRAAQARRHVRHDAGAGRAARDRRRADRDRRRGRAARARGHVRPERPALAPSYAVDRLAEAVGALAGREVALERPKDASLGDYATNVALQSAKALGRPPRELAEELAAKLVELPQVETRRGRGAGLREPPARRRVLRRGARGDRRGLRRRVGRRSRSGSRSSSSRRTRPARSWSRRRATARTATAVARLLAFAGTRVEREYYFNDAGGQMDRFRASVEAVRRGEEPPEDGYHGEYIAELAREPGDPVPRDARADQGVARALPHRLRHVGQRRARPRRRDPGGARAPRHLRGRRARSGRARARTATTEDRPLRPLGETAARCTSRSDVAYLQNKFDARLRPRDLRPRRRPPRLRRAAGGGRARCSASTPSASRCCSTSSCT